MPWVSTCQTTTFSYDADGQRILTSRPNDTLVYTPFPDYEREVTDGGAVTERTTYSIAGQMVGVRVKVSGGSNTLYYTYTDHLGSVVAMSNTAGGVVSGSLARYDPFGNYRTWPGSNVNPTISDRGFTGHVHDNTGVYPTENVGLIYMNARYYLPEVGRFVSADTIVPDPVNPQSYNRYSYALNSPVNFTDPGGHCVTNERELTSDDPFDCTVEEMSQLTWETRMWWLNTFMKDSGVFWFQNILGILAYFADDPQFSPLEGWASLSDAGVLIAIQDGWRLYNHLEPINDGKASEDAREAWAQFFRLRQLNGDNDSDVASQWGTAEQEGVNYGVSLAEPLKASSDFATQVEIETFVWFGNRYRSLITDHADQILTLDLKTQIGPFVIEPTAIFDPRTVSSGVFVYFFSRGVISKIAESISGR